MLHFTVESASDNASIRISSSVEKFDEFQNVSKTSFYKKSTFQDYLNRKVMADSLITISDKTELRVEGSYDTVDSNDSPTSYFAQPVDKTFWAGKVSLTSDTSLGLVEANIYNNNASIQFFGPSPFAIKGVNNVTVMQLQDLFKLGTQHSFRLQTEYRHNTINSDVALGKGADIFYDLVAAGGMWNWALTPNFELTNSLRADHLMLGRDGLMPNNVVFSSNDQFDQSFNAYSSNNSAVWKVTNLDSFRISYGRGVQSPSLFNLGVQNQLPGTTPPFVTIAGNPNLMPTIVTNYETGYDRVIEPIDGKFHAAVFYKKTKGINALGATAYASSTPGYYIKQSGDVGNSETGGVELGLDGKINKYWSWDTSYIFQSTLDHFSATSSDLNTHYENTLPRHTLKAHLGYKNGPWETDAYGEVASHYDATYSNTTGVFQLARLEGYHTVSGRVAYLFDNNVTVSLFGSDLTQARVENGYGLENERRVYLSLSKKF